MSIKQVTPGVYNYGAYANPKQVKYNTKGIEAMGQAISMGVKAAGQYLTENKERLDTLNEALGAYTAEIGDFNFGEQNLAIANGAEEYSAWIKNSNKLLRKDPQRYYKEKAQFDNQQSNALALKDLISGAEAAIEGIRLEDVAPPDREKYLNMLQIANRSFKMRYDKDKGLILNLNNIDFGDPSSAEFIQNPIAGASLSEDIKLSDFLNKFDSYTKFGLKFNQNDENFQTSLANMGELYGKNVAKLFLKDGGGTRETISYEEMESDFKDSPHLDLLFSQYGEDIMTSMDMDEEQTRQYLSDMVLGMHVKQYGDKITRKQPGSGSGSGSGSGAAQIEAFTDDLFRMVRNDFSTFATSATGLTTNYSTKDGKLRISNKDGSQTWTYDFTQERGQRERLYSKIFDDVLKSEVPGNTKETKQVKAAFMKKVRESEAYVKDDKPFTEGRAPDSQTTTPTETTAQPETSNEIFNQDLVRIARAKGMEVNEENISFIRSKIASGEGEYRGGSVKDIADKIENQEAQRRKKGREIAGSFLLNDGEVASFDMDQSQTKPTTKPTNQQKAFFDKNGIPDSFSNRELFNDLIAKNKFGSMKKRYLSGPKKRG